MRRSVYDNDVTFAVARSRARNLFRPSSLSLLFTNQSDRQVLNSYPSATTINSIPNEQSNDMQQNIVISRKKGWSTIVNVVIVEAKELPDPPSDGSQHRIYCKLRLGTETYKSKSVNSSRRPEWRERATLHLNKDHFLRASLWDKGKQKSFMGSCVIDLSTLRKERTYELWQPLDDGFGAVHLNITMCTIRSTGESMDNGPNVEQSLDKYNAYNVGDWEVVGKVHVKVITAKGLRGKTAYCTLELANSRIQTPPAGSAADPVWNKNYVFDIYDITNTLDVKVHDTTLPMSLGRVTIPLLRIRNAEPRWYALKDKGYKSLAKGNCPRIQLEITLAWNPIKASLKLFNPKEIKYTKKPPKFDLGLVYNNLIFIRDALNFLKNLNEFIKKLFEWEDREVCKSALTVWLIFWYYYPLWAMPLLLLLPFLYFWLNINTIIAEISTVRVVNDEIYIEESPSENGKSPSLARKIQELPEVTLLITDAIEFIASVAERLYNLASFKVPFLSYLTIFLIIMSSIGLYYIPFNYLMMGFGIFKYTRKYLNPERVLNNDILDFISRIPDHEILRNWEELNVPEPQYKNSSTSSIHATIPASTTTTDETINSTNINTSDVVM